MPQFEPFLVRHLEGELAEWIENAPLPSLGAGPSVPILQHWLEHTPAGAPKFSSLSRSLLYLLAGDLDASHTISQSIDTADGSFLHGIMHRREGDFSNAKYWFRRVGKHPVLLQLATTDYGDAMRFIDRCEAALGRDSAEERLCERLQWLEWQSLYAHFAA